VSAARGGSIGRLWAPWRMPYIARAARPAGCLFCALRRSRSDREHLILARRPHALLLLNRFPYNPGHLMVAVARHAAAFHHLNPAEAADWIELTSLAERALAKEYHPHGMNYGLNSGRVAGAGFPGHLHLHLVPRWDGDTNFMPVIGETRVLPESLDRTWARLRGAIRDLGAVARRTGSVRRRAVRGTKRRGEGR
jgi:ATP adenylyltransferase